MSEVTDRELLRRLGRGDRKAAGTLFDRHYEGVYTFAARFLGDSESAADAAQEAFLRLLRYRRSFTGHGSVRGWLLRITRNVCVDLAGIARRDREGLRAMPPPDPAPPPRAPDPRLARLERALERLPAASREVLVLRRFHDLSYAEIARVCGISEGAARVRAHRALEQLRREMESDDG